MTRRKARGFTLIELLVVIAIIAILAALLFPVFLSAKERSRLAGCNSNLHEIMMAFQMYCDEYNGMVPLACDAEDWHDRAPNASVRYPYPLVWNVLKKHCRGQRVWRCPADKGLKWLRDDNGGTGWGNAGATVKNCYDTWGSSYSYRTAVVIKNWDYTSTANLTWSNIKPIVLSQVPKATRAVIFFDPLEFSLYSPPTAKDWNAQWHHFKYPVFGWNMAFADGHVRTITKDQLFNPPDHPNKASSDPYAHWLLNDYYIRADVQY